MKAKSASEDILAGLELAVREAVKPENLNRWVSVRERSITGILKDCGVDVNYSSAFLEELHNVGLIEIASRGVGMRYMVRTCTIPDAQFLARKIYDNNKARRSKDTVNDGYKTSRASDLRPLSNKNSNEIDMHQNSTVRVIPAEIARLGEIGYIVRDNSVYEVMVIGVAYDSADRKRVVYTVECYLGTVKNDAGEEPLYNVIKNVSRKEFFKDIASALANISVYKYVKRK